MFCRMQSDGRKVSVLGYGAMRLPTVDGGHANSWAKSGYSESTIDQEMLDRQIRYLLEHGVNYFDSTTSTRRLHTAAASPSAASATRSRRAASRGRTT